MGLTVSDSGGGNFEPVPAGVHTAVCYSIVDLGSSWSDLYQKWQRQILITWEIPSERIEIKDGDGNVQDKPRVISKTYTPSLNEKAHLRADLTSWRGRDFTPDELKAFNLKNVLGATCMLNVIHVNKNNKTYANVKAVIPGPKGTHLQPENPIVAYDIDEHGTDIPDSIPDWVREKIESSQEYKSLSGEDETSQTIAEDPVHEDSIPF